MRMGTWLKDVLKFFLILQLVTYLIIVTAITNNTEYSHGKNISLPKKKYFFTKHGSS